MSIKRSSAAGVSLFGQAHIPGLARIDKKPVPSKRPESAMQKQSRGLLSGLGYHTMEVGASRPAVECECPKCGNKFEFTQKGYVGTTPGYPDLTVFRWNNFPPVFLPLELKGNTKTPVRPEQKLLSDAGRFPLVYSLEAVVRGVLDAELAMDAYRFPESRRVLIETFLKENAGHLW